jgi:non-specific serine/threonine protein kinase
MLDNCEQVATACAQVVTGLLRSQLDVVVIATSRIPLRAPDEHVYAVPPLAEAVDLFVDRAASMAPTYALTEHNLEPIAEICDRLAGLPLAIELTASWVRTLSPLDLVNQLGEASHLASTGGTVAARHRDLSSVLDSSWQWLNDADQAVAAALGVFRGGFTREAAQQVAGASLASLSTLTERSLIQRLPDAVGGSRYELHELIRTYALARLEALGSRLAEEVRWRHFDHFLGVAEGLDTPEHTLVDPTLDSPVAREQANLDAATSWVLDHGDAERALRIIHALHAFYPYSRPHDVDRIDHLTRALALPWTRSGPAADSVRGKALNRLGYVYMGEDLDRARELFIAALDLLTDIGDQVNLANSLRGLAWCAYAGHDLDGMERYNSEAEAVAREVGDDQGVAWNRLTAEVIYGFRGDPDRAVAAFDEAYAMFGRNHGYYGMYRTQCSQAEVLLRHRRWREAVEALASAFAFAGSHHFTTHGGDLLECLSFVASAMRHDHEAAQLAGASATWRAVHGERSHTYWSSGETDLARTRNRLGEAAWVRAYADGSRLTAEGASDLAGQVIRELRSALAERPAGLTEREVELLRLVADGLNNRAIAERLVLSPRTVHAHLRSIFVKLGVTTRTSAAHEAVRLNLV